MGSNHVFKGVVLVAESGSMLEQTIFVPKPLVRVGGVPTIFRTIEPLTQEGVGQVWIVLRFRSQRIANRMQPWP